LYLCVNIDIDFCRYNITMIDEVFDCLVEFTLPNKSVCSHLEHANRPISLPLQRDIDRAAALFRAMGEPSRLRLLALLDLGESCVGDIAESLADKLSTVSQRLKVLRAEGLLNRRRDGKHLFYSLADNHVSSLLRNALAHASELETSNSQEPI
jgi:DNA-binding transcriptional ArsR family regulator